MNTREVKQPITKVEFHKRQKELLEKIDSESAEVNEEIGNLSLFSLKLKYTTLILALALITLSLLFITDTRNFLIYWLISSFVFLMINPFIFLIPTGRGKGIQFHKEKEHNAKSIYGDLKNSGRIIKKEKKLFIEFGWKLFFLNCQPLAPGFIVIFLICMAFGSMLFLYDIFDTFTYATIIVQCFAIIIFYAGIWFVKPHSEEFISNLLGIRVRARESYRSGFVLFFKYILVVAVFAAVGGVVMLLALLLPGFTLGRILEDGSEIEFKLLFFIIIFISQVIFVRYIQGGSSRNIVGSFLKIKQIQLEKLHDMMDSVKEPAEDDDGYIVSETADLLVSSEKSALELNLFRTDYHDFVGYFPVCLISPNTKMIIKLYEYYPYK